MQDDFYIDNGLMVFTKEYHLKREYFCKNNAAFQPPELLTVPPYDAEGFIPSKKAED
jgi:hypothetical protein